MNARRGSVLLACACLAPAGCAGPDLDQSWNLHETRSETAIPSEGPLETSPGDFVAAVPLGVDREWVTLAATDSLTIGNNVRVVEIAAKDKSSAYGVVFSGGRLRIGEGAQVGSIYATATTSPLFAQGVFAHGFVRAAGRLPPPGLWRTDLGTFENAPDLVEEFRWDARFPAEPGLDRMSRLADTDDLRLDPGAYGALVVEGGATMRLSSGTYWARSFEVRAHAQLLLDNTTGPVVIWVRDRLAIEGEMVDLSMVPTVLVGYAGTSAPTLTARFRGTLVAPRAAIFLPATAEPHGGSFFGRNITLADGAIVEHRAFGGVRADTPLPAVVCAACLAEQAGALRECSDALAHAAEIGKGDEAACMASCGGPAVRDPVECDADCRSRFERREARSRERFASCSGRSTEALASCEHRAAYRAGTCWQLGYFVESR